MTCEPPPKRRSAIPGFPDRRACEDSFLVRAFRHGGGRWRRRLLSRSLFLAQPPLLLEELGQDLTTGLVEYAGNHVTAMVQPLVAQDLEQRVHGSGFLVRGTVHDLGDAPGEWHRRT